MVKPKPRPINNIVVVSDTHCGCGLALMPPSVATDESTVVSQSPLQRKLWGMWEEFWGEWVPEATRGEPFVVVHNGDAVEGVHHGSTNQVTANLLYHRRIAQAVMEPVVQACEGRYYHIRGTEAHVGKAAEFEEDLAERLGAVPNREGHFARYDLWMGIGEDGDLVHLLHHIGTTGSAAYEATAVHKELTESFNEASRWGYQPPSIIVRSHRHRHIQTVMPWHKGEARAVVTPAWQAKTAFAWKIPGARLSTPQFGGVLIRKSHGRLFADAKVWTIDPSPVVMPTESPEPESVWTSGEKRSKSAKRARPKAAVSSR